MLVVDDSEDTTEMVRHLLEMGGATVHVATSGLEALQLAQEREFDVVLSDISMPGMDGFEFLGKLRKLPGKEDVPAIALTGFGRPEDVQRAVQRRILSHTSRSPSTSKRSRRCCKNCHEPTVAPTKSANEIDALLVLVLLAYFAVDVLDGPDAFFMYFSYHARYRSIRSR